MELREREREREREESVSMSAVTLCEHTDWSLERE